MAIVDPKALPRDTLAKFLPDHEAIRRFERLFFMAGDQLPNQVETLFRLVQEASIDAGIADTKAKEAIDLIERIASDLEASGAATEAQITLLGDLLQKFRRDTELDIGLSKANEVHDLLKRLAQELEFNASRPPFVLPNNIPLDYLSFSQIPAYPRRVRDVAWNPDDDTLNIHHSDGVTQQVGQELYGRITNNTGSLIPNGSTLGINPATNSYVLFIADGTLTPITIIGVTTQDIPDGAQGRVTVWGQVRDIDTTGTPYGEVWTAGDVLYVSPTVAGGFTIVKPTAPNLSMPIAQVLFVHATLGRIAVRPTIEQQLFYGQFIKTSDQTPAAVNTAYAITWDSATIANGVSIDGGTPSRIVVDNAGLYKFSVAFQLTSSSASVKNVWLWFRKNGVDVASSALLTSLDSATAIRTPSRSQFFSLIAGDYIELMFASDSTAMTIDNIASTAFAPAAPAAILSVNQEQQ